MILSNVQNEIRKKLTNWKAKVTLISTPFFSSIYEQAPHVQDHHYLYTQHSFCFILTQPMAGLQRFISNYPLIFRLLFITFFVPNWSVWGGLGFYKRRMNCIARITFVTILGFISCISNLCVSFLINRRKVAFWSKTHSFVAQIQICDSYHKISKYLNIRV